MAFEPKTWANGKEGATPITADELNRIEDGVATIELKAGPKGDPGKDGAKGDQGDPGKDGAKGDQGDPGKDGAKGDQGDPGKDGAKGDQGDPGKDGAKGDPGKDGAKGDKGAPGFPTEEDWDNLVARVDALEAPSAE